MSSISQSVTSSFCWINITPQNHRRKRWNATNCIPKKGTSNAKWLKKRPIKGSSSWLPKAMISSLTLSYTILGSVRVLVYM
ncbi:hypothetical protein Bca101_097562 [Brassica carinata]